MIWEELDKNLITTDLEVTDYKGVMQKLGGMFIEQGYCKESYVNALINRESKFPTGLDIDGFGVAIPHTDVSHVIKHGIGIAQLKNPVRFVQMGTDDEYTDVKIVFMLAVDDSNTHIDKLQAIIEIIQDNEVLQKLANIKNVEEIIEIIKEKENK